MNLTLGTLKNRIKAGEQLKEKPKSFFDLDFGEIFNQLFVDATSGSRAFVNSRISKILHNNSKVVQQFINSNENRGIMHYYHDLLISQKEYYKRFLEIKQHNNKILSFKSSFPTTNDPLIIFDYCSEHQQIYIMVIHIFSHH